jgi:3-phenylpropionate/trans-cinnamate dioxygenase ferredoxin subunit
MALHDKKVAHWTRVCSVQETHERPMLAVHVDGSHLLVIRAGDQLHACERACPHERVDLAGGRCSGTKLFCPRHFVSFDLTDGQVSGGWEMRPLRIYPVRITGDDVSVDVSALPGRRSGTSCDLAKRR